MAAFVQFFFFKGTQTQLFPGGDLWEGSAEKWPWQADGVRWGCYSTAY